MKDYFSIGELADFQQISKQTLIYYDKIGLFRPAYVDPQTGYRYYSASQIDYLDTILIMKKIGFSLITLRNGNTHMDKYKKTYAEKLLYLEEDQSATMHFHWTKMEDIINRGGGNVLIRVYNSKEDGSFDDTDVTIHSDGREYTVPAGTQIRLTPGESITVYPYMYHDFEVEKGSGAVLLGEVSMCNDDNTDNRFYEPMGRFPEIEEDEAPYRLLCNEYPPAP